MATTAAVVVAAVAGLGAWVYMTQVRVPEVDVVFVVPEAPELTASGPDQTVYRIDATRTTVAYEVDETLAGIDSTARGTTSGVAGDILVDTADPGRSEVGDIVVNVAQFVSDEYVRDQRLQHDFLQSQEFPLATFSATSIEGLPEVIEEGVEHELVLEGDLTVKEIRAPATFTGTARLEGDELHLSVGTDVLLSTYDAGPIRLLGVVSTGDEVRLTLDAVAVDVESGPPPNAVAAPDREVAVGEGPSFSQVIQPIIEENCASCHAPDEVGALYWEIDEAGDAVPAASGLGLVVGTGYMPPWHATDLNVPLKGDARLSQDQIDAVVAWAEAGGPLDVDPSTPIVARGETGPTLRDDVRVALPEPYDGRESTPNDYRCFILDPGFTEDTWVKAHTFVPDQVQIAHHATMFRLPASGREAAEARDAADPDPGWQCFDGTGAGAQFAGWAPGAQVTRYPDGSGMKMAAGEAVVVQMHYHYAHTAPPDQSEMVFELIEGDTSDLREVTYDVMLGPAEIPCAADQEGPLCDRGAKIAQLVDEFGPFAAVIPNALNARCGVTADDFAHMTDGVAEASCTHRTRRTGVVNYAAGHMHEVGEAFRMTLRPGEPDEVVLLDIENWDFSWQRGYQPVDPVRIEAGDEILIECRWDRDRKPQKVPSYIVWNEGTEDEMCYSTISVVADP